MNKILKKVVFGNFYIWLIVGSAIFCCLIITEFFKNFWHGIKYTHRMGIYRMKTLFDKLPDNFKEAYIKAKEDRY